MATLNSYKYLIVWQKSYELVKQIYNITETLPHSEQFDLVNQMHRYSVSIPSNIAEGQQRHSIREYRHFIGIAKGSAAELETQLLLCNDIYNKNIETSLQLLYEVQKMLGSLNRKLEPKT
jgi:four helix bundle protein